MTNKTAKQHQQAIAKPAHNYKKQTKTNKHTKQQQTSTQSTLTDNKTTKRKHKL